MIRGTHLQRFGGRLVPGVFLNQDADPFIYELYRAFPGALDSCSGITVTNARGEHGLGVLYIFAVLLVVASVRLKALQI